MSQDPYSARVRELFAAPQHAGSVAGGIAVLHEDQGLRIGLSAGVAGDSLETLRFKAWGCPHVIAAAEEFCGRYEGQPASRLLEFSASDLMQSLSVPVEKTGRILVLEDAVASLGRAIIETD